MHEFMLTDLSDAGQLFEFKAFCRQFAAQRIDRVRLRIVAEGGFMPSALYWRSDLARIPGIQVEALLDGSVGVPGLAVWTGSPIRRITEDVRVTTGGYSSTNSGECERALEALVGAMSCTDAETRARFRERTAEDWLTKTLILGPEQLRRVFWLPPAMPASKTETPCR